MIAYATLTLDSPRRAEWMRLFGSDRVRLESAESRLVLLPGSSEPRRCYRAAVGALSPQVEDRIRRELADRRFGGVVGRAEAAIRGPHGLPIVAGPDLIVTVEAECYL